MHHIPSLIVIHGAGEGWHWSAVQPGDQIAEHVAICIAAFEAAAASEIEWRDRKSPAIGESGRGWTIPAPVFAVAGPAVHALKKFSSALNTFRRIGRLGRNLHRGSGLFFLER